MTSTMSANAATIEWAFGVAAALVVYAYAGYPLTVWALARMLRWRLPEGVGDQAGAPEAWPSVSLIIPAHNERRHIVGKLANVLALDYPAERLEIICVSDGSTDGTPDLVREAFGDRVLVIEVTTRGGKSGALNAGLDRASNDLVIFSDASILLEPQAMKRIVAPFSDPRIGCVSGEDRIEGHGGEALYGRYELFLRREESKLNSIVGASGCFYAQRRQLCGRFVPNLAPDFLSVLRTVAAGYRAVSEPGASGTMAAVDRTGAEFERKVRTLLRGMTTLATFPHLLNPFAFPVYAFELLAHKLLRWLVPAFLIVMLVTAGWLASDSVVFLAVFVVQVAAYAAAAVGVWGPASLKRLLLVKAAAYFVVTNAAAAVAWLKYFAGVRQEIWSPSQRTQSTGPAS